MARDAAGRFVRSVGNTATIELDAPSWRFVEPAISTSSAVAVAVVASCGALALPSRRATHTEETVMQFNDADYPTIANEIATRDPVKWAAATEAAAFTVKLLSTPSEQRMALLPEFDAMSNMAKRMIMLGAGAVAANIDAFLADDE